MVYRRTYKTPESVCLRCGIKTDAASHILGKKEKPLPGDISFCLNCGYLMKFGDDLKLCDLTPEEHAQVSADPDIVKIRIAHATMPFAKKLN